MIGVMLVLTATVLPAINGSQLNNLLQEAKSFENNTKENTLVRYLTQINNRDFTNKKEIFNEMQAYLSIDDNSFSFFNDLCSHLEKKLGSQVFDELMNFMFGALKYLNENELEMEQLNTVLYEKIASIKASLLSLDGEIDERGQLFERNHDFLAIYSSEEPSCMQTNSAFDEYWIKYGRAKCFWYGYMPSTSGDPSKFNVNRGFVGLWSGENFYQWHQNAVDYIIGLDENTGKAPFVQLMNVGIAISLFLAMLSSGIFSAGFFSSNPEWILAGGVLSIIGLMASILTAGYLYIVLYYFLFGSNAYFEMQRFGNVDFTVHVVNETGYDITSDISVVANSVDAYEKYDNNEPVYPQFENVNWSYKEFEYELVRVIDQSGNEEPSTFCLHGAQESAEKWKKAVPPAGEWRIVVDAEGYEKEEYIAERELLPGECVSFTITLTEK